MSQTHAEYEAREVETEDRQGEGQKYSILGKLAPARLTSRIILVNVGGLILLVSGILYFNQFRQGLIDARVQSLLTQGQIISAAIASEASADTGSIVIDPDRLMENQAFEATENEDTAPIVYNQRIDAVEKRESFAVKAPETSTPPSTNEVERPAPPTILTSPTSKEGDDFDVDW